MTRNISATNKTRTEAEVVRPVRFIELDFPSEFVRLNSSTRSLFFDSNGDTVNEEFKGVGDVGKISAIDETPGSQAGRVVCTLTGLKTSLISLALQENYQGRVGKIWRGNLNADHELDEPPDLEFRGLMDTMPIKRGQTADIGVVLVNRFVRWDKPVDTPRYDNVDQQTRVPGDVFFEFVPELVQGKEIRWGVT